MNTAAVVIGVDRTGGLTPLTAAASGAEDIATWLREEGYEVLCLTDRPDPASGEPRPVRRQAILDAVTAFVDRGTIEKLVVYFAGHGYLNDTSEIWLLSGAPVDPTEAIDATSSVAMARESTIRNVVFVSDACRSTPAGPVAQRVRGGTIFPNQLGGNLDPKIDLFLATKPGAAAIEAKFDDLVKATGLFTKILRDSHIDPPRGELIQVEGKDVVPSRWLQLVLPDRVDEAAQGKSLALTQRAQVRLESDQNAFVALARFTEESAEPDESESVFFDLSRGSFGFGGGDAIPPPPRRTRPRRRPRPPAPPKAVPKPPVEKPARLKPFAAFLSVDAAADELAEVDAHVRHMLESRPQVEEVPVAGVPAWVRVSGAAVKRVTVARPHKLHGGDEAPADGWIGVEFGENKPACSVAIEFADGTGTVVAAFRNYLCRIGVSEKGVEEINYDPFAGYLVQDYLFLRERIDEVRAVAAAAAARGLIEIDRKHASALADATRQYKMFDPALGMIAALAYAGAGLRGQAASVLKYARKDLGTALFDLWLLAGAKAGGRQRYPFCPMMTQSWSYLEPRGVVLDPVLIAAGRHSGFWTTFSEGEMPKIAELLSKGVLE